MAEGVWQIVFVVFLAYAMMPLQIWEAVCFGIILPSVHIGLTAYKIYTDTFQYLEYNQVSFRNYGALNLDNKITIEQTCFVYVLMF